jgi:uncharacterized damage-inducible protein DinB
MNSLLQDMYGHQEWADAEHWRAIGALEAARDHLRLRERLHHIHQVQRMFVWAIGDRATQPSPSKPADFAAFDDLKEYARGSHDQVRQLLSGMTDARLAETISMPWFKPPLELSVGNALAQMAMHSQYHRGQNAVILRELGGEPPTTDLIVWHWKGRPAPGWA